MYKGTHLSSGVSQHEYRHCLAPSPTTALAEAIVLQLISRDPVFSVPSQVFSYRWPQKSQSGWSYEYFVAGYKLRNSAISEALREDPRNVAVVADLKSFYPSVKPTSLLQTLGLLMNEGTGETQSYRDEILDFMRQLLDASPKGIPIGPSCGHFLGHIALRGVDKKLQALYGKRYFRYVDDIVIVTPSESRREALAAISSAVQSEDLQLNESKTATLERQHWENGIEAPDLQLDDSFGAFTNDLAMYLAFHSAKAEELRHLFLREGFCIPVSRLVALSKYSRFRYFLRQRKRFHAASVLLGDGTAFVARAAKLRNAYEEKLQSLMGEAKTSGPELQRWRSQRARRVVNVLFYLWSPDTWQSRVAIFDAFPELVEQRSLAMALSKKDVSPILPFYGRGAAAFAEIWNEYTDEPAHCDWPTTALSAAEIESLVTLSLTGAIRSIPDDIARNQTESRLLQLGRNSPSTIRLQSDLSYVDEVESLTLHVHRDEMSTLIKSRYAIQEASVLDALALIGSEYRS